MRSIMVTVVFIALVGLGTVGCSCKSGSSSAASGSAATSGCGPCATGKAEGTAWCDKCQAGFVAGKMTTCKECVLAAKAGTTCEKCAAKTN